MVENDGKDDHKPKRWKSTKKTQISMVKHYAQEIYKIFFKNPSYEWEIVIAIECKCNSSSIVKVQWDMFLSINGMTSPRFNGKPSLVIPKPNRGRW
jgi:hypothetical protein